MDAFFNYFYTFSNRIVHALWAVILAIKDAFLTILDIDYYFKLFDSYKTDLSTGGWIAAIITHIIMLAIVILVIYLIVRGLIILFRFKVPVVKYEKMKDEVVTLKREVMKANYEKDKILAMKVAELGMEVKPDLLDSNPEQSENENSTVDDSKDIENEVAVTQEEETNQPEVQLDAVGSTVKKAVGIGNVPRSELRFPRLNDVDAFYKAEDYVKPKFSNTYNLEELCINFRNYAASRLGLYYELEVIKETFASFGATKMLILQGISGTGKTSLPYAIGQYIMNPSLICSVQPSWRDRTELFGYYNDFTKKYSETDFLKTMYESHYQDDLRLIILDEMNIARVEYYFAEMLSILELPREDEQYIPVVSSAMATDPDKMQDGKIWIPSNVFYIGTINNDDSTFAVADKVYDRAIPIDLDDRAKIFEAPDTEPMRIDYSYLNSLYEDAKKKYPISAENLVELDKLDQYLIEHFRLTFGNRILRQIKQFVPCYVACGGTELEGIDFMFQKKILRKFESLGLGFIRDEIDDLIKYIDRVYGEDQMKMSRTYLIRLKKLSGVQ